MKLTRSLLALALTFSISLLSFLAIPLHTATAREVNAALQRGERAVIKPLLPGARRTVAVS